MNVGMRIEAKMKNRLGLITASTVLAMSLFGCSSEAGTLDEDIQSIGCITAES